MSSRSIIVKFLNLLLFLMFSPQVSAMESTSSRLIAHVQDKDWEFIATEIGRNLDISYLRVKFLTISTYEMPLLHPTIKPFILKLCEKKLRKCALGFYSESALALVALSAQGELLIMWNAFGKSKVGSFEGMVWFVDGEELERYPLDFYPCEFSAHSLVGLSKYPLDQIKSIHAEILEDEQISIRLLDAEAKILSQTLCAYPEI